MSRANPLIANFNGGELSPLLASRPEQEKYQAGLKLCENAVPRIQGALERRGGTCFVSEVSASADRTWLVPFVYSQLDAFVLEFGDEYIRFYRDRGVFEAVPGTPYEIVSPYTLADLTASDGSFAVKFCQSGDVIYMTHPNYPPQKLTRVSNTNWTLAEFTPKGGPFKDVNTDESITVYVTGSVTAGSVVTVTANSNIFQTGQVGGLMYIQMYDTKDVKPWGVYKPFDIGDRVRSDGKFYECTNNAGPHADHDASGEEKPIHTKGRAWDGPGYDMPSDSLGLIGLEWEYLHAGYGWIEITGYTNAQNITGAVVSRLPEETVGASNATFRWALGAWSDAEGWPDNVCFFRERLTFVKGRRFFCSVAGDFEKFEAKEDGQTTASSALQFEVQSARGDAIQWLASGDHLLAGTGGSEVTISEQSSAQAFGPGNVKQAEQEAWGSRGVAPILIGSAVIYVEKSGHYVREIAFSPELDTYQSEDMTTYSDHLFSSAVVQLAYERRPRSVVWAARADGMLLGCTYMKQQNVLGWHRHPLGGSGIVESVVTIPSPDGTRDDLWMIVRRTIDGSSKRYVEYMTPSYQDGDDATLIAYSDCHLTYDGAPATTISGLDHLEGCTVQVKADAAAHPDCIVTGGEITLQRSASTVIVGLKAPHRGQIMPLEFGADLGTAQGKLKRVHRLAVRLYNSLGGTFGKDFDTMDDIEYRSGSMAMDAAPSLCTGIRAISVPGGYDPDASICWEVDGPFPFTLVALIPEMATNQ